MKTVDTPWPPRADRTDRGRPSSQNHSGAQAVSAFEQALIKADSTDSVESLNADQPMPCNQKQPWGGSRTIPQPGNSQARLGNTLPEPVMQTEDNLTEKANATGQDGASKRCGRTWAYKPSTPTSARTAPQTCQKEQTNVAAPDATSGIFPLPIGAPLPAIVSESGPPTLSGHSGPPPAGTTARTTTPVVVQDAPACVEASTSGGSVEWQLEFKDPGLPIQSVSLERLNGGSLNATLQLRAIADTTHPPLVGSNHAASIVDASIHRLRQRLAHKGISVGETAATGSDDSDGATESESTSALRGKSRLSLGGLR